MDMTGERKLNFTCMHAHKLITSLVMLTVGLQQMLNAGPEAGDANRIESNRIFLPGYLAPVGTERCGLCGPLVKETRRCTCGR